MNKSNLPSFKCVPLATILVLALAGIPALAQDTVPPVGRNALPGSASHPTALPRSGSYLQRPLVFPRPTKPAMRYKTSSDSWIVYPQPTSDYTGSTTNYGGGDGSGSFITSLGPFTYSNPQSENFVPGSWATWGSPPNTESSTPNVLWNAGFSTLHVDISGSFNTAGFELEPDQFQQEDVMAVFHSSDGDSFTVDLMPNGSAGALLYAVQDDTPGSTITSIDITDNAGDDFAIAQLRLGALPPPPPNCSTPRVLHNFNPGDGPTGVRNDQAGNIYGTTGGGGDSQAGMAYQLAPNGDDWTFTPIYSFTGGDDGGGPSAVIPGPTGPEGGLYGAAGGGITSCPYGSGCGLVFRLTPPPYACRNTGRSWTERVVHRFTVDDSGGYYPGGNLVFDQAGNLYGTTAGGSDPNFWGTVYELTHGDWTEQVLYSFPGGGSIWQRDLLAGSDGNLYGSVYYGGDLTCDPPFGCGRIFQLVPSGGTWIENDIYVFEDQGDGANPGKLVEDSFGNIYGTAVDRGYGTVFKLSFSDRAWVLQTIAEMDYREVAENLAIDATGSLYWTTVYYPECSGYACSTPADDWPYGAIYVWPHDRGYFDQRFFGYFFDSYGPLAVDANGNLFGTTPDCGAYGAGTIWMLPTGTP